MGLSFRPHDAAVADRAALTGRGVAKARLDLAQALTMAASTL